MANPAETVKEQGVKTGAGFMDCKRALEENNYDMDKAIVFVQRKRVAGLVTHKLQSAGISTAVIHGDKTQAQRIQALEAFRHGRVRALVATDVAARGLDVDGITHVINYELPLEAETYVHRIGRTARAGAEGDAGRLCMASERSQLRAILIAGNFQR